LSGNLLQIASVKANVLELIECFLSADRAGSDVGRSGTVSREHPLLLFSAVPRSHIRFSRRQNRTKPGQNGLKLFSKWHDFFLSEGRKGGEFRAKMG
jgi:hypothetical protein